MNNKRERKIKGMFEINSREYDFNSKETNDFLEKYKGKTARDFVNDQLDDWFVNFIKSGELFNTDIYDLVDLMDNRTRKELFEKIDQLSLIDLIVDYKLNPVIVKEWLRHYAYYKIMLEKSDKQFVYQTNTSEQVVLYYYLNRIEVVDLGKKIADENKKAKLLSFLLNRDEHNLRKCLRNVGIKANDKEYFTEAILRRIVALAEDIKFVELRAMAEADLKRLYK